MKKREQSRLASTSLEYDRSYDRWVWFMNLLTYLVKRRKKALGEPETNTLLYDGLSKTCREIKERAKSWRALDLIYNHTFPSPWKLLNQFRFREAVEAVVNNFWIGNRNAQAVRNRYKLIRNRVQQYARELVDERGDAQPVKILSVACGSAQTILESAAVLKREGILVEVLLIDNDETALASALVWIRHYGLEDCASVRIVDVVRKSGKVARDFQPDIIEEAGLGDYLVASLASKVINGLYDALAPGGLFITCNIMDNPERPFLTEASNWGDMIYRTSKELEDIVINGGFPVVEMVVEPHQIHAIAFARKFEGSLKVLRVEDAAAVA